FFFSSRRRHTRSKRDWSSDVCSSDLARRLPSKEQRYLADMWDRGLCANCGQPIPEGKRVGSGNKADGGFCSLACFGTYHRLTLRSEERRVGKECGYRVERAD